MAWNLFGDISAAFPGAGAGLPGSSGSGGSSSGSGGSVSTTDNSAHNVYPNDNVWHKSLNYLFGNMTPEEASAFQEAYPSLFRDSFGMNMSAVNVENSNEGLRALGEAISNADRLGTQETNALNKWMWEQGEANTDRRLQEARDFEADQAKYAMDRQEYWSNTAHQREVADLKAAGLNPVLSASGAGASTPSGLMGGSSAVSANSFSAVKPNIVGAFSTAGEFIGSMLSLRESIRQFGRKEGMHFFDKIADLLGFTLKAL